MSEEIEIETIRKELLEGKTSMKLTWSDELHQVYKWSLWNVAQSVKEKEVDIFEASTALALCFNLWKEETIHDLEEYIGE